MKLRNKKTGEIVEVCRVDSVSFEAIDFDCSSLADLTEEWEDCEDGYWWIDGDKDVIFCDETDDF